MVYELLKWAQNALEQSYNKPVLPYLVIALNKEDGSPHESFYSIPSATKTFLTADDFRNIHKTPRIRNNYTKYWQDSQGGSAISSGEDLLKSYFSDVAVVHLPSHHYPTKMREQIMELYRVFEDFSLKSQKKRADRQMRFSAETFPLYSRKAFSQFASDYKKPFDFSEAWFDISPVSFQFKDSILNLAHQVNKDRGLKGTELWNALTDFFASCFLLSWGRNSIQGKCSQVWWSLIIIDGNSHPPLASPSPVSLASALSPFWTNTQ